MWDFSKGFEAQNHHEPKALLQTRKQKLPLLQQWGKLLFEEEQAEQF